MGYHRAGFDVVGIDSSPQPRYPFEFHQADALTFPLEGFDAIHASPPYQAYSATKSVWKRAHPELIEPTRARLELAGVSWVIENVPGSPLNATIMLCGSSFGLGSGRRFLQRHRYFETNWRLCSLVPPCNHDGREAISVVGAGTGDHSGDPDRGGYMANKAEGSEALGIDWMTKAGLTQAIPPAYTEWIGEQLAALI